MQVCSICHGMDGNGVLPNFPRLAGQPVDYLVGLLENFRAQGRSDPAGFEYMWGLSHRLNDPQIRGLAEYFAKQVAQRNASVDAALMTQIAHHLSREEMQAVAGYLQAFPDATP